tara:strand:- start:453 stop:635 length:183 start_codon:yes stop_codon:yes gene_type:complete
MEQIEVRPEFVQIEIQTSILEEVIQDYEDRAEDKMREGSLLQSYDLQEIADILKASLKTA